MKRIFQITLAFIVFTVLSFQSDKQHDVRQNFEQPSFHVAILMPFYLHNSTKRKNDTASAIYDYYEGVKMALTDLERMGMKLTLHVYDTEADVKRVDSFLKLPEMLMMNTIIGPIYPETHEVAERFCGITKIPLVSPFKFYERQTSDTFPHINLVPSDSIAAFGEGQEVGRVYPNHKIIIISDGVGDNYRLRKLFKEGYSLVNKKTVSVIDQSDLAEVYAQSKSSSSIVVYAPTDSVDVLKKLVNLAATGRIKLVIPKDAKKINGFSKTDFIRGKVLFGDNNYFDKYAPDIIAFRKVYRERFKWEPRSWHYKGYDQIMWLGQSLMTFKQTYPSQLGNAFYSGLVQQYSLKSSINGGFENGGCKLIYYNQKGLKSLAE